jgi:hypothetical protein
MNLESLFETMGFGDAIVRARAFHLRDRGFDSCAADLSFSYPEPFLRAVRRGALAKSKTGNHKNMVKDIYVIRTITFVVANQMPV